MLQLGGQRLALDPAQLVGTTLSSKYTLIRVVGRGGMGTVFEGRNAEIGKRVAVKLIDMRSHSSAELRERLRREARAASSVESDAIVQVFDVGEDPAVGLYMVMEFLPGEDLAAHLARCGRLDGDTTLRIGLQVARALSKAHQAGVVHRDLKPANVFLTTREDDSLQVKILDFGISKLVDDERRGDGVGLTKYGSAVGTPHYMSPEQVQSLTVDQRTDVWGLGCILYECLAGQSPYPEMATYEQTILRILTSRPQPLAELTTAPAELVALIGAALEPDLDVRIPDCAVFAQRLAQLLPDALAGAPKVVLSTPFHGEMRLSRELPATAVTLRTPPSVDVLRRLRTDPGAADHLGEHGLVSARISVVGDHVGRVTPVHAEPSKTTIGMGAIQLGSPHDPPRSSQVDSTPARRHPEPEPASAASVAAPTPPKSVAPKPQGTASGDYPLPTPPIQPLVSRPVVVMFALATLVLLGLLAANASPHVGPAEVNGSSSYGPEPSSTTLSTLSTLTTAPRTRASSTTGSPSVMGADSVRTSAATSSALGAPEPMPSSTGHADPKGAASSAPDGSAPTSLSSAPSNLPARKGSVPRRPTSNTSTEVPRSTPSGQFGGAGITHDY